MRHYQLAIHIVPALKDRAKFKRSYAAYFMKELHCSEAKFRYLVYNNRKLITERL
jgi:hypothetical protein